jgi:hypothetical protein
VIVGETIKQEFANVREEHPNNLVRVTIDTGKCCFNISRRPVENDSEATRGGRRGSIKRPVRPWIVYCSKAIPEAAFDVSSKRIPNDFKINWPLQDANKNIAETGGDIKVTEGAAAAAL